MTLNLAAYLNILDHCVVDGITHTELLSALISTVDPAETLTSDQKYVSRIFAGERGFPKTPGKKGCGDPDSTGSTTTVFPLLLYVESDQLADQFHKKVLPLLDSDRANEIVLAFRHVVQGDTSIFKSNAAKFQSWTGWEPTDFVYLQHVDFCAMLAGLFRYAVLVGKYTTGISTLKTIKSDKFWEDLQPMKHFMIVDGFGTKYELESVSLLQGLDSYLHRIREEYSSVKTFFDWKPYFDFDELFVCNDIQPQDSRGSSRKKALQNATVRELRTVGSRLILYGIGGIGKSMMLRHLLFDTIDRVDELNVVPFFICLRNYQSGGTLEQYILDQAQPKWPGLDAAILRELLNSGKAILLLDGLDEVKSCDFAILRNMLNQIVQDYPKCQFIMSSRPFDNHFSSYTQFRVAEVCGLRIEQVYELVDRVGFMEKNPERRAAFKDLVRSKLYSHDEAFCKNPLLLTIMMLIYEQHRTIPTRRHEFYNEAFAVLFQRHDLNKDGFMRDLRSKLSETEFKDIFAEFCAKTYFREKFEFTKDQFISIVSSLNSWRKVKDRTGTDQFLIDACVNLCIMDECRTEYRFIHRSFQEYFCACWLRDKSDAQLTAKIEFFEAQQKRTMEDCVFSMLHEMAEERVDGHMIIPVLERCLSQRDGVPGYWSYLMNQYPTIPYVVGKDIDMPFNPQSAILLYVLEKESFLHDDLVPDEIPHEDIFTRQIYFDHAPDTPVNPSEERRIISAYRERGLETSVVRWDMEIETKRLYEFRAGCQELMSWFETPSCPLWNEYVAIKGYYDSLKKKITLLNEDFLSA